MGTKQSGEGDPPASDDAGRDWIDAMRAGDFARAWEISDRHLLSIPRHGKHSGPRHRQFIWRGEALAGKRVLVRCYHGLGDTIQFLRFMPALRGIAAELIVFCQSPLLSLVRRNEGVDRVLPLHDGRPEADFDVDIEIMEIPHAIRAGRDLIEMSRPYLRTNECNVRPVERKIAGATSIGLVWEVGDWDKRRSIPPGLFRKLNSDGVRLCSLQMNPAEGSIREMNAVDISTPDIEELACKLKQLDLLICVDTMIAHLACALGCEVWVLLHADCDWRWPAAGSRSIWYPTARLFRQSRPGNWSEVIAEVKAALDRRLAVPATSGPGS
jgi:hypothetical protein